VSLVHNSYTTPSNALVEMLQGSRKAARECAAARRALAEPDCLQLMKTDHLRQQCAKTLAGGGDDMYSCIHCDNDRSLPDAASLRQPRSDLVLAFCLCMPCWPALAGQRVMHNCKFRLGNIHRRPQRVMTVKANAICKHTSSSFTRRFILGGCRRNERALMQHAQ